MVAADTLAPTIGLIPVYASTDGIVSLHCPAPAKRDRRIRCDHVVTKLPLAAWEQAIVDEIEVECRRCGVLTKLREWR